MPSTSTTDAPSRALAWAISTPTGPPPSTSSRRGTSFMPVASRLVQTPSSESRPGIGGSSGSEPVEMTTWPAVYVVPSTSTAPGPVSRPSPRITSSPTLSAHLTWPSSE